MKKILPILILLNCTSCLFAQKKHSRLPILYQLQLKLNNGFNEKYCGAFISKGAEYDSATQIEPSLLVRKRKPLIINTKNSGVCTFGCRMCRRPKKLCIIDTPIIETPLPIVLPNSYAFPNPTCHDVYLDIPYLATKMQIMSINGSVLRTYNLEKTNQRQFFIGDLATGIYFFCIFGQEQPEIIKVVKSPV